MRIKHRCGHGRRHSWQNHRKGRRSRSRNQRRRNHSRWEYRRRPQDSKLLNAATDQEQTKRTLRRRVEAWLKRGRCHDRCVYARRTSCRRRRGPSRKRHNVVLRELLTVDKLISKIAARCNDKANEQLSTGWQRQGYL